MALSGIGFHALVADDDPAIRRALSRALRGLGFTCDTASDGEAARKQLVLKRTDLLISDLRMPIRHGHRLVSEILERPDPPLVVVITGLVEPAIASDLMLRGVGDLVLKPFDASVYVSKWLAMLRNRSKSAPGAPPTPEPTIPLEPPAPPAESNQETVARDLARTSETLRTQLKQITESFEVSIQDLERKQESLSKGFLGSVRLLTQLMRTFNGTEGSHAVRVERLAEGICEQISLGRDDIRDVRLASLLHDLGQFGMPDSVRSTPVADMTQSQLDAYRRYPEIGATLLSEVHGCERVSELVMAHMERFDGTGFPNQTAGVEIPLGARIVRIADGIDTFLMNHPDAHNQELLGSHLMNERELAYDPEILDFAMGFLLDSLTQQTSFTVRLEDAQIGDLVDEDLFSKQGHLIARRGAAVTEAMKVYVKRILGDISIKIERTTG